MLSVCLEFSMNTVRLIQKLGTLHTSGKARPDSLLHVLQTHPVGQLALDSFPGPGHDLPLVPCTDECAALNPGNILRVCKG